MYSVKKQSPYVTYILRVALVGKLGYTENVELVCCTHGLSFWPVPLLSIYCCFTKYFSEVYFCSRHGMKKAPPA